MIIQFAVNTMGSYKFFEKIVFSEIGADLDFYYKELMGTPAAGHTPSHCKAFCCKLV
jgi:hypothetical protein